jgi:two-component system KDP operon response regulator KdpE
MATEIARSRVLVVDDQPRIARTLQTVLSTQGYEVRTVYDGQRVLPSLHEWQPGLVITDLMMEQMDGFELCRRIRATSNVPIIVLSAERQERSKVDALDSGADDYIMKPFATNELLARVRAALRRAGPPADGIDAVGACDFRIDLDRRRVYAQANEVRLTPKEFDLFVYFARHPDRVIAPGTILDAVWGEQWHDHREYVRVFIRQLRKKLEADPSKPRYFVCEPWVGYRFYPHGQP